MARTLGPTLSDLRPLARQLGPTLRDVRPFLRETEPIIRKQLRPFTRQVLPTVRSLRPAARDLARVTPDLRRSFSVLNYLLNTLAYNPPGKAEEGYLFWTGWANHAANLIFTTQDAHGPVRRGTIVLSCSTATVLDTIIAGDPQLGFIAQLSGIPRQADACPSSSQAPEPEANPDTDSGPGGAGGSPLPLPRGGGEPDGAERDGDAGREGR
jgi:phospholipid/cholesterol/gamma-HCH transport system substrate-binding protein